MKTQACEQCAKRKVRCNREEPCSNCKRRRHDRCTYAEISPAERIKKLEALVISLGGSPDVETQDLGILSQPILPRESQPQAQRAAREGTRAAHVRSLDPVVIEEDGQQVYLESNAWQNWLGRGHGHMFTQNAAIKPGFALHKHPDVFQGFAADNISTNLNQQHPSVEQTIELWDIFSYRVYPVLRICFKWALDRLRTAATSVSSRQLTDAENAFMFSLYLASVISLSEDECWTMFSQQRSDMILHYQVLSEKALSRAGLFCMSNVLVIKASLLYMIAGFDRLSTRSLWSLMGLVSRNAERLGIHRDGALLGLSPADTEDRRRLWWQLQHLDLFLAVRSGQTPMTLTADWDAKMPLNIEDEDIDDNMTEPPKERQGLTNLSYCLYTSWVIDHQRHCFNADNNSFKDAIISQMEDGLNKKFLQYCDPIKPLHSLLQISARSLVCGMRLRILHPMVCRTSIEQIGEQLREALLSAAVQSLEYNLALHSQRSIQHFYWLTRSFFPWHAFMIVLVEISQQRDLTKTEHIWSLLNDLYRSNPHLSQLSEDRRSRHAAELVVSAWKAQQSKSSSTRKLVTPDFVGSLETKLEGHRAEANPTPNIEQSHRRHGEDARLPTPASDHPTMQELSDLQFDLDFQDIDWSFWSSID